jgi:hypothetical protein
VMLLCVLSHISAVVKLFLFIFPILLSFFTWMDGFSHSEVLFRHKIATLKIAEEERSHNEGSKRRIRVIGEEEGSKGRRRVRGEKKGQRGKEGSEGKIRVRG